MIPVPTQGAVRAEVREIDRHHLYPPDSSLTVNEGIPGRDPRYCFGSGGVVSMNARTGSGRCRFFNSCASVLSSACRLPPYLSSFIAISPLGRGRRARVEEVAWFSLFAMACLKKRAGGLILRLLARGISAARGGLRVCNELGRFRVIRPIMRPFAFAS